MATINSILSVLAGPSYAGKGPDGDGSLTYRIRLADRSYATDATNDGMLELAAGTGAYELQISLSTAWGSCKIVFFNSGTEITEFYYDLDLSVDAAIETGGGTGNGDIAVDHNYGGTDEWLIENASNIPVDNAVIRAYVAADYNAGTKDPHPPTTQTGSDGRWLAPLMLDPDVYTIAVYNPVDKLTKLFSLTVTA